MGDLCLVDERDVCPGDEVEGYVCPGDEVEGYVCPGDEVEG